MSVPLVALTGATGFIGRHLLKELPKRGYKIRVLLRRPSMLPPEASGAVVGDLAAPRNMSDALAGVDAVIHSAGLAHGMSGLPEDDYRTINTEATVGLARAAARGRTRRLHNAEARPSMRDLSQVWVRRHSIFWLPLWPLIAPTFMVRPALVSEDFEYPALRLL